MFSLYRISKASAVFAVGVALVSLPLLAQAQFLNDTANGTYYYPDQTSVYDNKGDKPVNPTAAFAFINGTTATVANSTITGTFASANTFGAAVFNGFIIVNSRPLYTTRGSDGCIPLYRFRRSEKVV